MRFYRSRQCGLGRPTSGPGTSYSITSFVPALRELGYVEGQNIVFDRGFADGDANRLDELSQQLVAHRDELAPLHRRTDIQ